MISLYGLQAEFSGFVQERCASLLSGADDAAINFPAEFDKLRAALNFEAQRQALFGERSPLATYLAYGRALAQGIHIECHAAHGLGTVSGARTDEALSSLRNSVNAIVTGYRLAVIRDSPDFLLYQLQRMLDQVLPEAKSALGLLGGSRDMSQDPVPHAGICHEAMRLAMLSAAGMMLYYRMTDSRLRSTTMGIAARRETKLAELFDLANVVTSLDGLEDLQRISLAAWVSGGKLIQRPETPYTRLEISPTEELRVHHKNTRWIGVGEQQAVIVRCKVEPAQGGMRYAVAEFEGPTTSAGRVWESWLQASVRNEYDLAPESIHWFTSFPALTSTIAPLHLDAHTARSAGNAE
jgi:hypothetical protein